MEKQLQRSNRFMLMENKAEESRSQAPLITTQVGGTNFDANMVIVLAALLCALLCALGLNSIVRCAIRCSRRLAVETPRDEGARLATKGLKHAAILGLPVVIFGFSTENGILIIDCAICLAEFVEGEKVRVLPRCGHGFHMNCIDTWLLCHSSCPTCRRPVLDNSSVDA